MKFSSIWKKLNLSRASKKFYYGRWERNGWEMKSSTQARKILQFDIFIGVSGDILWVWVKSALEYRLSLLTNVNRPFLKRIGGFFVTHSFIRSQIRNFLGYFLEHFYCKEVVLYYINYTRIEHKCCLKFTNIFGKNMVKNVIRIVQGIIRE